MNMATAKQYFLNLLIALDQGVNTVFGGDPDETISSRLWRHRDNPVAGFFVRLLNVVEPDHCQNSLEPDDRHTTEVL